MTLEEKLMADFKDAMKTKNETKTRTISFLRSELKYAAIDKKKDKLDDADVLAVIRKLIKQRQDSIDQFEKGARLDLVQKEKAELEILKAYLPQEMSADALKAVINEVALALGATTMKDMGRVMKEVVAKTQGAADSKMISDLVRQKLSGA